MSPNAEVRTWTRGPHGKPTTVALTAEVRTIVIKGQEVRTLMVGCQRASTFLFEQVPWVMPDDLEPFARVDVGDHEGVRVVGRHRETGLLVKSYVEYPRLGWEHWEDLPAIELVSAEDAGNSDVSVL